MPYIKQEDRDRIFETLHMSPGDCGIIAKSPGELNYIITEIILEYLNNRKKINYTTINEIIGVLECCKLELYRRKIAPYEDEKIQENGDVY